MIFLFRLLILILLVGWLLRLSRTWTIRVVRRDSPESREPEVLRACARCGVRVPARSLDAAGRCDRCLASR